MPSRRPIARAAARLVLERVGQRRRGVHELDALGGRGEVREEARRRAEGQHRRADVVVEAGQGQLVGPAATPGDVGGLDDVHGEAALGQRDGRGEPVGAGADNDGIAAVGHACLAIQRRQQRDGGADRTGQLSLLARPVAREAAVEPPQPAVVVDARHVLPMRRVAVHQPPRTEVLEVEVEAPSLDERAPAEERADRDEHPTRRRQPVARRGVDLVDAGTELGEDVVVGVLHEREVAEQDEEGKPAQPALEVGVGGDRVEVGPVAAAVQPECLELGGVARLPRARAGSPPAALQHSEQEQVVVAEHRPAVVPRPDQPGRSRAPAAAGSPPWKKSPRKTVSTSSSRVGQQRLLEAFDVALDITDDEQRAVTRRG